MVKVVISGAGPAGLMVAQHLIARPNYDVHVFEKRADISTVPSNEDRTYPMALQASGLEAVEDVPGLKPCLEKYGKYMNIIQFYQNNKARKIEKEVSNFYIERSALTRGMLEHLRLMDGNPMDGATDANSAEFLGRDPTSSLNLHFECGIADIFLNNQTILTDHGSFESFDHVVAADGARSMVRTQLAQDAEETGLEVEMERVVDSYKSLSFQNQLQKDVNSDDEDDIVGLEPDRMHGWFVDGQDQVLLVPVRDEIASGVYIFPNGKDPFEKMIDAEEVMKYFESVSPKLGNLISEEEAHRILMMPVSGSWTVRCNKLTVGDGKVVLIGDAAHAISASLGLGCNSALQDAQVLNQLLRKHDDDWHAALTEYEATRLVDVHAVADMSDYARSTSPLLRTEMMARMILRKALPDALSNRMRPLPFDLTNKRGLSYSEMHEQTRWWTSRVERHRRRTST